MLNSAKMTVSQISIRTLGNSNDVSVVNSLLLLFSSPFTTCFLKQLELIHKHKDVQHQKCMGLLPCMKSFESHCLNWDLITVDVILNISVKYFRNHLGPLKGTD